MRPNRGFRSFVGALLSVVCAGVLSGCENNSEIPLAKVPPPPESFTQTKAKVKIPFSGSPNDANERRK
jgi:hypothetical protein